MIIIVSSFVVTYALYIALGPLIKYIRGPKGLRKYPEQNWLSGISTLAYEWHVYGTTPIWRKYCKGGPQVRVHALEQLIHAGNASQDRAKKRHASHRGWKR